MTIKECLQNVHYDEYGKYLWAKHDDGNQLIGEVRGWCALQHEFENAWVLELVYNHIEK